MTEPTNGIDGETNGIHAGSPLADVLDELRYYADDLRYDYDSLDDVFEPDERLSELCGEVADMLEAKRDAPEGDALSIMRDKPVVEICKMFGIDPNGRKHVNAMLGNLADMVERDYVSREAYEDLRDEFTWTNTFLHRIGKKCGTKDVPSLKAYVEQLESKVEELEAVDRNIAETDSRWEAAIRDLERMTAERDEWKAKAEGFTEALEKLGCSVLANGTVFGPTEAKSAKRAAAVERLKSIPPMDTSAIRYVRAMLGSVAGMTAQDVTRELIDLLADDDGAERSNDGASLSDENDPETPDFAENPQKTPKQGQKSDAFFDDSREKLEADIRRFVTIREQHHKRVSELERERDMWRMRCGELLDAAHGMQGIADAWEEMECCRCNERRQS